jgi:predicted RNA-binding Zn-ribbon protein involved in translation (DUF1610 family)
MSKSLLTQNYYPYPAGTIEGGGSMMKVILEGESATDQLERWIAACGGQMRDALNIALARLEYAEAEAACLHNDVKDEQEANTCPDCGVSFDRCSYCEEADNND